MTQAQTDGGERRRTLVVAAALFALVAASLPVLVPDVYDPSLFTGDGAVYMVCARSLLAGEGYQYLGEPFVIRPPGFSFLLAPVMAVAGTDYRILTLYVALFGASAVALLFVLVRPRLGTPLAVAVAVALWLNPGFLRSCSQIMSDVPGLAAMLGCLVLERRARRRRSAAADLGLGLAIGAATWVRSMNVFLAPALVGARLLEAWRRRSTGDGPGSEARELGWGRFALLRLALPAGVAVLCLVPWSVRNAGVEPRVPAEDTLFHSYSTAMWHVDWADPGSPRIGFDDFAARVQARTADLLHVLGSRVQERGDDATHRWLALAALACWAVVLVVRRGTAELMTGAMLFVIAGYFGFMNRLLLPVYALVLPAVAEVVRWALGRALPRRAAGWTAAALVLALAAADFEWRGGEAEMRARESKWLAACRAVERTVAPDELLAANFGAHFSVELDRPVLTLRWAEKRGGVEAALELIRRRGVEVVLCDRGIPEEARLMQRLVYGGGEVLGQSGPWAIVRV